MGLQLVRSLNGWPEGNCFILNLFAQNLNVSKLEPREALSFERKKIVIKQTLKLFESSTCLENGKLLPSGVIYRFGQRLVLLVDLGNFLFSDCGSQENLSCTCECFVPWWVSACLSRDLMDENNSLSTSYLLYDPNLFTTKGQFSGASKKCLLQYVLVVQCSKQIWQEIL